MDWQVRFIAFGDVVIGKPETASHCDLACNESRAAGGTDTCFTRIAYLYAWPLIILCDEAF